MLALLKGSPCAHRRSIARNFRSWLFPARYAYEDALMGGAVPVLVGSDGAGMHALRRPMVFPSMITIWSAAGSSEQMGHLKPSA